MNLNTRKSTKQDIPAIMQIIAYAQQYLASLDIDQWQNGYPNEAQILNDINNEESFVVLNEENKIIATYMFSTRGEANYNSIDGKWLTATKDQYGVIHRIAVAENQTNKGLARKIISACEQKLSEKNIKSMRIDTHNDNKGMQHLVKKLNYTYCGIIIVTDGSERLAFEKLV